MIVDGKEIAEKIYSDIKARVAESGFSPRLVVITAAPNFETKKYLALKQKKAEQVGVLVSVVELPASVTTKEVIERIGEAVKDSNGIIVQLPLPAAVDVDAVLKAVPPSHDVDVLNPATTHVLPAVVAAFKEILSVHGVEVSGKYVTVIGNGRLVGQPAAKWFTKEGAFVSIVTKETPDIERYTRNADIVVCGAGDPGFLTPSMVKDGVVILDAGTSEEGGVLKGDADPTCAKKASLFTPVPGGVGPITVAVLLRNLVDEKA